MATRTVGLRKADKSVTTAGTAESIMAATNVDKYVTEFTVYAPMANTGANVYIGNSDVDNRWIPIPKGQARTYVSGNGNFIGSDPAAAFDLSKIYVDVDTSGDDIVVEYIKGES